MPDGFNKHTSGAARRIINRLTRLRIQYHNKKEIPADAAGKYLLFAKLLRDADKLDIYRVLAPFLEPENADKAPKFIKAHASELISPEFINAFVAGSSDFT